MRLIKKILYVLAAFAWLLMTSHCKLEVLPGLEFLACVSESDCHGNESPDGDNAGCCAVEKSDYKTEQFRVTSPSPNFLLVATTPLLDVANTLPAEVSIGVLTAAPPELPASWRFSFRTALPARAPSFVS